MFTWTDAERDPSGGLDVQLEGDLFVGFVDGPPEIGDVRLEGCRIAISRVGSQKTGDTMDGVDGTHQRNDTQEKVSSHDRHLMQRDDRFQYSSWNRSSA